MSDQLESALVIALSETIKWGSSINGTLPAVTPTDAFDPLDYQTRDRVLAFRDLLVSAAVIKASIQVSNVYNYKTIKPTLQGPVSEAFDYNNGLAGNTNSQVRHVKNTSIPYDAARYADADLYGRDALVYEILSRACQQAAFVENPVPSVAPAIPSTSVWSTAEGAETGVDVNAALPVNVDLFKKPDQTLAERDNLVAAYVSRLAQILKNPFEYALRLLVQTTVDGQVQREPEVYALVFADATKRVWQSDPSLDNTNKITYSVVNKTLQWVREDDDEVHVPQIYGLVIPGIDPDQLVQTVPEVPTLQDAQFWRSKAALIVPDNDYKADEAWMPNTVTLDTNGGYPQINCVSLPVPAEVMFEFPSLPLGSALVNALVKPCPKVVVPGQATYTMGFNDSDGGITFAVDVQSGHIEENTYLVVSGDGIVYNSITYLPGSKFVGVYGVTTFTQAGDITSKVRLYSVSYRFALPPGAWNLEFDYADVSGASTGFGVKVQYVPTGGTPQDISSDVTPLPVGGANVVSTSESNLFDVLSAVPFTLTFNWTYGQGQLQIRKLTMTNARALGRFSLSAKFQSSSSSSDFTGQSYQSEVVRFPITVTDTDVSACKFYLKSKNFAEVPLQILQLDVQSTGTNPVTPLSAAFPMWRQECVERAERVIVQGYNQAVSSYAATGTVPTYRDSGSHWSNVATEQWMSFAEIYNPRLRQIPDVSEIVVGRQYEATTSPTVYNGNSYAVGDKFYGVADIRTLTSGSADQVGAFVKARPGHVGYPCLVPYGLYVEQSGTYGVKSYYDTPLSLPHVVTCQPWMIEYGLYVAQPDFWMPDTL